MPRLDPGGLSGAFKRSRRASALDFLVPDRDSEGPAETKEVTPEVSETPAKGKASAKPQAKKPPAMPKAKAPAMPKAKAPAMPKAKAPAKPKARKAPAKPKAKAPAKLKAKKAPAKPKAKAPAKPKAKQAPTKKADAPLEAARPAKAARPLGRPLVRRRAPGTPAWPRERGVRAWAARGAERFVSRLLRLAA